MGVKLQTIGDTKSYMAEALRAIYHEGESDAVVSFLIESVTGIDTIGQLRDRHHQVTPEQQALLLDGFRELLAGKPVQYVTGFAWFMGRKFRVNSGVLIPRQETEELVIETLRHAGRSFSGTIIDFCTGSGCIAVTLSCILPSATVWATDISPAALATATVNSADHNAEVRLLSHNLLSGDFTGLPPADIIVANPPYVRNSEKESMKPLVLDHEPHEALFVSDSDPLLYYRALLQAVMALLRPGGWFCFEINEALGEATSALFTADAILNREIINDINSKNRFIAGTRA